MKKRWSFNVKKSDDCKKLQVANSFLFKFSIKYTLSAFFTFSFSLLVKKI